MSGSDDRYVDSANYSFLVGVPVGDATAVTTWSRGDSEQVAALCQDLAPRLIEMAEHLIACGNTAPESSVALPALEADPALTTAEQAHMDRVRADVKDLARAAHAHQVESKALQADCPDFCLGHEVYGRLDTGGATLMYDRLIVALGLIGDLLEQTGDTR